MRKLLRHGTAYTVGTAAQMLAAAIAVPAITRLLPAHQFGVVALGQTIGVIFTPLVTLGLPVAVTRLLFPDDRTGDRGSPRTARTLATVAAGASLAFSTLLALAALRWGDALAGDRTALTLAAISVFPMSITTSSMGLLQFEGRPLGYVTVALMGSAGAQATGILLMVLMKATPSAYMGGYLIGTVVAAGAGVWLARSLARGLPRWPVLKHALGIGLPTLPHALGIYVLAVGDRMVIQLMSTSANVGRYQVAYALGALPISLLAAIQTAWVPLTYAAERGARWPQLARTSTYVTGLGALLCGLVALGAPIGLAILAPASYSRESLSSVVALVAAAALPWAIYLPMTQILFWMKATKPFLWITPTAAVIAIAGAAVAYPSFGLEGVAAATVVGMSAQALFTWWSSRRLAEVPWRGTSLARNVTAGAMLVAAALALPTGGWGLAVRIALCIGAAGVALMALADAYRSSMPPRAARPHRQAVRDPA